MPVLPDTDPRAGESHLWALPLAQRLIKLVQRTSDWRAVEPRALEEVVAELFDGFGYEVELTRQTRDGGRDIIAVRHSHIKDDKYLIECKRWEDRVGVQIVRELLGVRVVEPGSGLILVSTSGFTADAKVLAQQEQVRWLLALKDRDDVEEWIRLYARQRGWIQ